MALDAPAPPTDRLEQAGALALFGVAGALQFSIAGGADPARRSRSSAGSRCLIIGRERFEAPRFFWPLLAYGGVDAGLGRASRPIRAPA